MVYFISCHGIILYRYQEAIFELITTEKTYVESLKLVNEVCACVCACLSVCSFVCLYV